MNKLQIGVVVDMPKEHFPFWNDGLREALNVLSYDIGWDIFVYNVQVNSMIPTNHDFYLFWSSLLSPQVQVRRFPKQGLLFGGGPTYAKSLFNFDIIFAESKVDMLDFKRFGIPTVQAFGTNTKLFKPMNLTKYFDYFYPAAFAKWKHHEKFVEYIKDKSEKDNQLYTALAVGYMQPNDVEKECYEMCEQHDVLVLPWVSPDVIARFYNHSNNVLITADASGGCQRTVLEAKACNTNVIIESDSPKLKELAMLTYEDVVNNWNQYSYAKKLQDGIMKIMVEAK